MLAAEVASAVLVALVAYFMKDVYDSRPKTTPQSEIGDQYDFIIVGAGSAGCVIASRLSEIENLKVLLIEAGYDERLEEIIPLFFGKTGSATNWNYTTVNQKNACRNKNGYCFYPQGYVMGGTSATNAMIYVRGNKVDYDSWEQMGHKGWGYESVLPYFLKIENMTYEPLALSKYHSTGGLLKIGINTYETDDQSALISAGLELGLKQRDYNGEIQSSIAYEQRNVGDGIRQSSSRAYLEPFMKRKNLHIAKGARVIRVMIDKQKKKAMGVEYIRNRKKFAVTVRKDVILSAGAINTPQLLMLSGIGPQKHLEEHNIPLIADLPVGDNLQDHTITCLSYILNTSATITNEMFQKVEPMLDYVRYRKGIYTHNKNHVMVFFKSSDDLSSDPPENQIFFVPYGGEGGDMFNDQPEKNLLSFCSAGLQPKSIGTIRLRSAKATDPPIIDPNYFSDPEDVKTVVEGLKFGDKLIRTTKAMTKFNPVMDTSAVQQCLEHRIDGDAFFKCVNEHLSHPMFHAVGTASMGKVVDDKLKLIGIDSLRVIDASVIPKIIRGNTFAPTVMIAEKASDIIKKHYGLIEAEAVNDNNSN